MGHNFDTFLKSTFGYRKLRKCGHKSEVSGKEIIAEGFKLVCKYDDEELLKYVKYNYEVLYWLFDRTWEDWLVLVAAEDIFPRSHLNLEAREKQIIDKVVENLKTPLGTKTAYIDKYDPTLLLPVPRITSRKEMGYNSNKDVPFYGIDIWNCYEISYLNKKGKPQMSMLKFAYDSDSENIVESKSVKLYLNSFNQEIITGDITKIIKKDIQRATKASNVYVELFTQSIFYRPSTEPVWLDLDTQDIEITDYSYNPKLLEVSTTIPPKVVGPGVEEGSVYLRTNLLKSNCRMSGLPDWATAYIAYRPDKKYVTHESLLRYLTSYRNHREFHEPCCEKITTDLIQVLEPKGLSVELRYTRRGGCDINPIRAYSKDKASKKSKDFSTRFKYNYREERQ